MIYEQALKFIDLEVFAIKDDQTIVYGTLIGVDGSYATVQSRCEQYVTHIKYLYPYRGKLFSTS